MIRSEIIISNNGGKWTINDKPYQDCTYLEQQYFVNFLKEYTYDSRIL